MENDSIFDLENNQFYIKTHPSIFCKNRFELNKFNKTNLYNEFIEHYDYDINLFNSISRKYNYDSSGILNDNGTTKKDYIKLFYIDLLDLSGGSDVIYDIILKGAIYRVFLFIDNNPVLCYHNKYNDNNDIKLKIFTDNKPLPIFSSNTIKLGIEISSITNKYNINLLFKGGCYDHNNRLKLISSSFKIFLDNLYENHLDVRNGKIFCYSNYLTQYTII